MDVEELKHKLAENLELLEHIAAENFRLVSNMVHGSSMDKQVDPYTMSLVPDRKIESENSKLLSRNEYVAEEMRHMWMYEYPVAEPV